MAVVYIYKLYRVLDANLNRAREGLRVVEEIARFVLDDGDLAELLRELRHGLLAEQEKIPGGLGMLLNARDSEADVGLSRNAQEKMKKTYVDLAAANFKRFQEAARVLEEYSGLVPFEANFSKMRFMAYQLEKEVIARLSHPLSADYSLYVLTGNEFVGEKNLLDVVAEILRGGATAVQLREKEMSDRDLIKLGLKIRALTEKEGALLIVNDRADLARAIGADGVHLGQRDIPLELARRILGPGKIVGVSTHSMEEALYAQKQGADYIGVGPIFATGTKDAGSPRGIEFLRQVADEVHIPKVAIGGIKPHNVYNVIRSGADGAAVLSAVMAAPDVYAAVKALRSEIDRAIRGAF